MPCRMQILLTFQRYLIPPPLDQWSLMIDAVSTSEILLNFFKEFCLSLTWNFIIMSIRDCHWNVYFVSQIQITHLCPFFKIYFNLILSSTFQKVIFHRLMTNKFDNFLSSSVCATCPAHPIFLDFIMLKKLYEEYKLWSSSFYNFLHDVRFISSKYSSHDLVLKHIDCVLLIQWTSSYTCGIHYWQGWVLTENYRS